MAVAIDASSPGITGNSGNSQTTSSFSPPANTVLVAVLMGVTTSTAPTNTGTALTWTQRKEQDGLVEIWTAPNANAQTGMTVTAPFSGQGALKVYVVTGGELASPVGATGGGTSSTNNLTAAAYTSLFAGSRAIGGAVDGAALGTPTSSDVGVAWDNPVGLKGIAVSKASNTATAGSSVTLNFDGAGTSTGSWTWAAVEIKPLQVVTISPGSVDAAATVPAPSLSAGSTVSATPVDGASSTPAPSLSAGSTASPDAVDAAGAVPSASITTGSVEILTPATVDASAVIPTPAVSTGQSIPAAVVSATAAIPTPELAVGVTIIPATVLARTFVPTPTVSVPVLPGETIDGPGQVEFGGIRWGGPGNQFRVQEITGWESRPALDNLNELRPSRHGAWAGRKLAQQRLVAIRLLVDSIADPTQVDEALDELAWATRVLDDDSQLSLVIKGYGEPLLAYGAVADYDVPWDGDYSVGAPTATVLIACPDPLKYSLTQQSVVVPAGGEATASNGGNTATPPRIRIDGPAENPVLTNITLDRVLAFDLQVEGGQRLEIDTQRGTVTIGTTDRRSTLAALSVPVEDFVLGTGSNLLTFDVDSGGATGAEFLFRSAKL